MRDLWSVNTVVPFTYGFLVAVVEEEQALKGYDGKTGEIAMLIKCLLCEHWSLGIGSQHPCKSRVRGHMPVTPVPAWQVAAEIHWPFSLANTIQFRFSG